MVIGSGIDKKVELTFGLTRRDYFVFHFIPFQPLHLLLTISRVGHSEDVQIRTKR